MRSIERRTGKAQRTFSLAAAAVGEQARELTENVGLLQGQLPVLDVVVIADEDVGACSEVCPVSLQK